MIKLSHISAAVLMAALVACTDQTTAPTQSAGSPSFGVAETGNGAPSGPHYNLNLIGVTDKSADLDANNPNGIGNRIFVFLEGRSKIGLTEGPTFAVLDANALDADGALFQLPVPDADEDGKIDYAIYVRPLGSPKNSPSADLWLTGCVEDPDDPDALICASGDKVTVTRSKGPSKFTNVTRQLLTITITSELAELLGCKSTTVFLFDPCFEEYFWTYDNHGVKLLQMRFYPIEEA